MLLCVCRCSVRRRVCFVFSCVLNVFMFVFDFFKKKTCVCLVLCVFVWCCVYGLKVVSVCFLVLCVRVECLCFVCCV